MVGVQDKTILVFGITGRQGGAVSKHLLDKGFRVRGLTRNPDSNKAREWAEQGVEMVRGDLNDMASLVQAMAGVHGVFAVQDSWEHGVTAEIEQGKRVVDAAAASDVQHLVYGSVAYADRSQGIPPHFRSKGEVERYLKESTLAYTILQPVFFMEMLIPTAQVAGRRTGDAMWALLKRSLGQSGPLQLITIDDIGKATAMAFADPKNWAGKSIVLAGDELPFSEIKRKYFASGLALPRWVPMPPLKIVGLFNREAKENFEFMQLGAWNVDLGAIRTSLPWVTTYEQWLGKQQNELNQA